MTLPAAPIAFDDLPLLGRATLCSPEATTEFARRIAPLLKAGDTLLLAGDLGSGKTHFARGLIQARLPAPEDVPSPTFTLVQTYDVGKVEIWHADLYRLTDPQDVWELGLDAAFGAAICLIEWPDRLGHDLPPGALSLTFAADPDADDIRHVTLRGDPALSLATRLTPMMASR
jgi:tRNA threonylcarbamoyladenosine biosynthesis protein TsaE